MFCVKRYAKFKKNYVKSWSLKLLMCNFLCSELFELKVYLWTHIETRKLFKILFQIERHFSRKTNLYKVIWGFRWILFLRTVKLLLLPVAWAVVVLIILLTVPSVGVAPPHLKDWCYPLLCAVVFSPLLYTVSFLIFFSVISRLVYVL